MTYGQMQTMVAKMLGNMTALTNPTWYPYITATDSTSIIWQAANRYIELRTGNRQDLDGAELFPELKTTTWDQLTVAGANSFARPVDAIAITKITCPDPPSATLPNYAATGERPLNPIDQVTLGILAKDSTVSDYPTLYSRAVDTVLYYPTTDSTTVTYLRLYGLTGEPLLTTTNQVLLMNKRRHNAVVTLAASMLASKMGWAARAQAWFAEAMAERDGTISANAMETPRHVEIEVEGTPDWNSINNGEAWG